MRRESRGGRELGIEERRYPVVKRTVTQNQSICFRHVGKKIKEGSLTSGQNSRDN